MHNRLTDLTGSDKVLALPLASHLTSLKPGISCLLKALFRIASPKADVIGAESMLCTSSKWVLFICLNQYVNGARFRPQMFVLCFE